jgi:hypothetical protein
MKANELRIGNWVICHFMNVEIKTQVLWMTYDILQQKYFAHVKDGERINGYCIETNCKPIPLTPELLDRCGFVKEGILYHYGKFSIAFGDTIITSDGRTYFNSWAILDHSPKYLHQIQNIYHALTGNELEVKM